LGLGRIHLGGGSLNFFLAEDHLDVAAERCLDGLIEGERLDIRVRAWVWLATLLR
jgi:hypothetical protein